MKIDSYETFTDRNGNSIRKHIRAKSIAEYNAKVEKIKASLNHAPLISDVCDEWQENHWSEININTQSCYVAPLKNIKEYFKGVYIDCLQPLDVDRFLHYLYDNYGFARQTLKLRLICLNQVCDYAILKGYINSNPCSSIKVPKKAVSTKRELPLSEDVEKVKNSVNSAEFGLFAFLLLYTGCRRGEALALRYEDIDRKAGIITIDKTIVYDDNKPIVQHHTKTDAGMRVIPLLKPLAQVLPRKKKGFIFTKGKDEPLSRSQYFKSWKKYRESIGIDMDAHQLRHYYATMLYEADIKIKDAQEMLGHASPEVTQKIYQHISKEQQKKAFEQLKQFSKKCTKNPETPVK